MELTISIIQAGLAEEEISKTSHIHNLVANHQHGTLPDEPILGSRQSIEDFIFRMELATREGRKENRRAALASAIRSKTKLVL